MSAADKDALPTLSYHEALEAILSRCLPLPAESVAFDAMAGRTLAQDVRAAADDPPEPKSAMDGFAVRAADTASATNAASDAAPLAFPVAAVVGAGHVSAVPLAPGGAVRIMTGAWLPPGADAVVKQEDTRPGADGTFTIAAPLAPGENVIARGAILARGRLLLPAGAVVSPQAVGLLAGQGHARFAAVRRPHVGLLTLGDELVEPGGPLAPGQLYVSNLYALEALCARYGALPRRLGIVPDDPARIEAALRGGLEPAPGAGPPCDLVLTLGGSHQGDFDFAHSVLGRLGATLHVRHTRINMGGSTLFATRGNALCFGLPGTPMAAWLVFEMLVRPALWRLAGRTVLERPRLELPLTEAVRVRPERANFIPAHIESDPARGARVTPLVRGSPLALPPSVLANGLIRWPDGVAALPAGTSVPVELLGEE